MDNDRLALLCIISSIKAATLVNTPKCRDEWIKYIWEAGDSDLFNEFSSLSIMAETLMELMKRTNMRPTFRVPAVRRQL